MNIHNLAKMEIFPVFESLNVCEKLFFSEIAPGLELYLQ